MLNIKASELRNLINNLLRLKEGIYKLGVLTLEQSNKKENDSLITSSHFLKDGKELLYMESIRRNELIRSQRELFEINNENETAYYQYYFGQTLEERDYLQIDTFTQKDLSKNRWSRNYIRVEDPGQDNYKLYCETSNEKGQTQIYEKQNNNLYKIEKLKQEKKLILGINLIDKTFVTPSIITEEAYYKTKEELEQKLKEIEKYYNNFLELENSEAIMTARLGVDGMVNNSVRELRRYRTHF